MKRYEEDFKTKLIGIDFETLEKSPHSIFGLSSNLELIYFNEAWFNFSKSNNGEPFISTNYQLGTSIALAISGIVREFYVDHYKRVLLDLKVWKHEYECSSPNTYRLFRQDVYPLKNGEGLIVVNSLKIEKTIGQSEKKTLSMIEYLDSNGHYTQCTNCRKTQRASSKDIWDWVPELVSHMPQNVSHSICAICYDFYWKYRGEDE